MKIKVFFSSSVLTYFLFCTRVCAEVLFPALRVYEVYGQKKIYLVGELHNIVGIASQQVDFTAGLILYDEINLVYVEPSDSKTLRRTEKNERKISPTVEDLVSVDIKREVEQKVSNLAAKYKNAPKSFLEKINGVSNFFKESTPDSFWAYSYSILLADVVISGKLNQPSALGLSYRIRELDAKRSDPKIRLLESDSFGPQSWDKECNTTEIVEKLVKSILEKSQDQLVSEILEEKKFIDPKLELNELYKDFLRRPDMAILDQCHLKVRNQKWIEIIKERLAQKGSPDMFLVGMAHLAGSNGLLAALKKQGYSVIEKK
jgi:hypothetical protein